MEVRQIHSLLTETVQEILGSEAVVAEDLSNIVDIGHQIFNANAFDPYVKSLINHIGKVIFVNRPYRGVAPSILMDGWEYGSILEKVSSVMPTYSENDSWNLVDGQSYDPNVFIQPTAQAKFYNKRTTFEVRRSVLERQVKQSFSSASQLNGFFSMLANETEKALSVATENCIMRTINNMTAEVILSEFPNASGYSAASKNRAVNLLYLYNQRYSESLTAANAITTPEFIRFAAYQMSLYSDRITRISTLFNAGRQQRFTPKDLQKVVMLAEFAAAADVYLQSDTYHNEFTRLIAADRVPFWQGSGTDYGFSSTSKIYVTPASEENKDNPKTIELGGVLGVIFDREALGVANLDARVTTQWNPAAEFTNYWYKRDAGYFNDLNENFVVFYAA